MVSCSYYLPLLLSFLSVSVGVTRNISVGEHEQQRRICVHSTVNKQFKTLNEIVQYIILAYMCKPSMSIYNTPHPAHNWVIGLLQFILDFDR